MAVEPPLLNMFVARMPVPKVNLAAFGSIVYPLSLAIGAPIMMLLAATTALGKDRDSYVKLRVFMNVSGCLLTLLHVAVTFTPLYGVVVGGIVGAPVEVIQPSRFGMMIATPISWAIAYRRFNQGLLIRFGRPRAVGVGAVVRLIGDLAMLAAGYLLVGAGLTEGMPGINEVSGTLTASFAITFGVICESVYVRVKVLPILRDHLGEDVPPDSPLTFRFFVAFYTPLAMTSLLNLLVDPIAVASLSRMPDPLDSLAVWPVISGLIFVFQSFGLAYNEVVVALLDEPGAFYNLRRFNVLLSSLVTLAMLLLVATPFSGFWFERVAALEPDLAGLAGRSMWIALFIPFTNVFRSWYQGVIMYGRKTGSIMEGLGVFLFTILAILVPGVLWGQVTGLYVGLVAFGTGRWMQIVWLWWRSRGVVQGLREREDAQVARVPGPSPAPCG